MQSPKTITKVTCATCGIVCEVPFMPAKNRPVYCSTCYQACLERKKRERKERLKKAKAEGAAKDEAEKYKVVVFDRHWLDEPRKEATKT